MRTQMSVETTEERSACCNAPVQHIVVHWYSFNVDKKICCICKKEQPHFDHALLKKLFTRKKETHE